MKKMSVLLVMLSLVLGTPSVSHALILLNDPLGFIVDQNQVLPDTFSTKVNYVGLPPAFDLPSITSSTSIDIYTLTTGDALFDSYVDYLTNGVDDVLVRELKLLGFVTVTSFNPESTLFTGNPFSTNGIDLQGNQITSIQWILETINYEQLPGTATTHGELNTRFIVNGEPSGVVPEPATMLLFGAGLVGAGIRRKFSV